MSGPTHVARTMQRARKLARRWERDEPDMQFLRITATLGSPVASSSAHWGRWHLDALLMWALMDQLNRHMPRNDEIAYPLLPLADIDGVWAASCLMPSAAHAIGYTRWRKRPDASAALDHLKGKNLPRSVGRHRAYDEPLEVTTTTALSAVAVGRPEAVRSLLSRIGYVGKKSSQGYGRVRSWDVAVADSMPTSPDAAMVDQLGVVTRPLPVEIAQSVGASGRQIVGGWRPPYWLRSDHRPVVVP